MVQINDEIGSVLIRLRLSTIGHAPSLKLGSGIIRRVAHTVVREYILGLYLLHVHSQKLKYV